MKKFELKQGDLYFGDHEIGEFLADISDAQYFFDSTLDQFFENRLEYREYIEIYGKKQGLDRYALLTAHGDAIDKWVYFDDDKQYAVQSWINKVDGKYSGLLLCVCNPGSYTPKSKKSILIVPDSDIDFSQKSDVKDPIFSLLVPKIGELDLYTIGHEVEQLKKRL